MRLPLILRWCFRIPPKNAPWFDLILSILPFVNNICIQVKSFLLGFLGMGDAHVAAL
jgi:hypothetical protein